MLGILGNGAGYGVWGRMYKATGDVRAKRHKGVTAQRLLCGCAVMHVMQVEESLRASNSM